MNIDIVSCCFDRKGEFVARAIAQEVVLVPVRGHVGELDSIYNLSEVAAFVGGRLDGKTNVTQLVNAVTNSFDVTPEQALEDILRFLGELADVGLVQPSETDGR